MSIAKHFPSFACARYEKSQQKDMRIGEKEAKARENGMMKSLWRVLKMRIISIGVIMEALAFMRN
jgi:hypothetical protein